MSNVHVSKEGLEKFARILADVAKKLEEDLQLASKGLSQLGETHKDRKYDEFKKFFDEDINKHLKPLPEHMKGYSKHLEVLAERVKDYDGTNLSK